MTTTLREPERLSALENYGILDSEFEPTFDRVTRLAAALFDAPVSLVSLIDRDRQWFKSAVGLSVRETARDVSFCAHAIEGTDVFVVPDATVDARFSDNPLVRSDPKIRFYAGAPLINAGGFALGTICVIDDKPRPQLFPHQREMLRDFAGIVVDLMEARRNAKLLEKSLARGWSAVRRKKSDPERL